MCCFQQFASRTHPEIADIQCSTCFGESNNLVNSFAAGLGTDIAVTVNFIKFGEPHESEGEKQKWTLVTMMDELPESKIKWLIIIVVAHED